jgi:hypothetical protein
MQSESLIISGYKPRLDHTRNGSKQLQDRHIWQVKRQLLSVDRAGKFGSATNITFGSSSLFTARCGFVLSYQRCCICLDAALHVQMVLHKPCRPSMRQVGSYNLAYTCYTACPWVCMAALDALIL